VLAQQLAQQQQQFQNDITLRGANRADQQLAETSALRRAQEAETARRNQAAEQDRQTVEDLRLSEAIPPGSIQATNPSYGRLKRIGMIDESKARPAVDVGPLLEGDTGEARDAVKLPTARQQDAQADNARQAAALDRQNKADAQRVQHETDLLNETKRYHTGMLNKPSSSGLITVQTVDANGMPVTQIVKKEAGATYQKPPSAVTQNRLDSAQAVNQTGNDIIAQLSDPQVAANLGPAMGRYNTMREFIGDPPPELSELAGQIESYALANMGVHGMRSVQGSQKISDLLDRHHTPESLIKAVKGLQGFSTHFLENSGRAPKTTGGGGGTVAMIAPDGRHLNVPADKVAELEKLGAKRQ